MNKITKIILIIIVLVAIGLLINQQRTPRENDGGVMAQKADLIILENPKIDETIASPLEIKGTARGNWFFEASFPIVLISDSGEVLVESYATADGEWMTEDFVPFTATLNFTLPQGVKTGTLILKKDNPSGLPENDDELIVPVNFK